MKNLITFGATACLLLGGMSLAQEVAVPTPAPAQASQGDDVVTLLNTMVELFRSVKDLDSANQAAPKLKAVNDQFEKIIADDEKFQKIAEEREDELLPLLMGIAVDMQRLEDNDFFGSETLQQVLYDQQKNQSMRDEADQVIDIVKTGLALAQSIQDAASAEKAALDLKWRMEAIKNVTSDEETLRELSESRGDELSPLLESFQKEVKRLDAAEFFGCRTLQPES